MYTIGPELPHDAAFIDSLLDLAFGPGRLNKTSYRYRQGVEPLAPLSLIARDGAEVVGTIRYWPVAVDADWYSPAKPALLLGPLAIDPARRGEGIGIELMERSLAQAGRLGHALVLLVGDLAYYRRVGFGPASAHGIAMPDEAPERLLVRELMPGALDSARGEIRLWRENEMAVSGLRAATP